MVKGDEFSITDLSSLHAPLDIPIPDPPAQDEVGIQHVIHKDAFWIKMLLLH